MLYMCSGLNSHCFPMVGMVTHTRHMARGAVTGRRDRPKRVCGMVINQLHIHYMDSS